MSRDKDQLFEDLRREAEKLEGAPSPAAWSRLERKLDRRRDRGGLLVPLRPWLRAAAVLLVLVVAAIALWPEAPRPEAAFAPQTVSVEFLSAEPNPGELRRIAEVRSAYRRSLAWVESADASGGELLALNVGPQGTPGTLPGEKGTPGILPGDQPGNNSSETLAQANKRRQTPALAEETRDFPETSLSNLSIFRWMEGEWRKLGEGKGEQLVCNYRKKTLVGRKLGDEPYFELAFGTTTGGTPALILQADTPAEKRYNYMGREGDRFFFKSQRPRGTGEALLIEWRAAQEEMIWIFGAPGDEEMGNAPFQHLVAPGDTARVEKWGKK